MDFTTQVPRSPFDELDGIPWLPRLIDKVHATLKGTMGEYTPYPCPMDQGFLAFYGLDAHELSEVIAKGLSDEAIATYVRDHATPHTEAEVQAFRQALLYEPPTSPEKQAFLSSVQDVVCSQHPEADRATLNTFAKLLAVDEDHMIPSFVP